GIRTVTSCDLAANPVNLIWTRTGLPVLHCPTGAGGRRLAVRLWRVAGTGEPVVRALPGPQLQALADALGPPTPSRQAAHDVLTAMAAGGLPVKGNLGGNRPPQP